MKKHPLTTFREKNGLSLVEMAERIDVTAPTVSRWENWQRTPRRDQMIKISVATRGVVTANDFFPAPEQER